MAVPVYIRSIIFTLIVPAAVCGWVPFLLAQSNIDSKFLGKVPDSVLFDVGGCILIAIGAAIYLWCVYDFTFAGRGTPGIYDPPRKLVVRGLYKYVRNPMYVGVLSVILGEVFLYGSPVVFVYGFGWWVAFNLFVRFYEEWALRKQFGEDYIQYLNEVNRWIPTSNK